MTTNQLAAVLLSLSMPTLAGAQQSGLLQKARYIVNGGPAAHLPSVPPNLPDSVVRKMEDAMTELDKNAVDPIKPEDWDRATNAAIKEMVKQLHIPHSYYLDPAETKDLMNKQAERGFSGIGMELRLDPKGEGAIGSPMPAQPAEKAGLEDDDLVVAVDGVSIKGLPLDAVVAKIRGPVGTPVTLTVKRQGFSQPLSIVVTRGTIITKQTFSKMAAPGVGYLYLSEFGSHGVTDTEVFSRIDALRRQGARKLIFDLRFNPGGDVATVESIVSEFLRNGQRIVTFKRQGQVENYADAVGDGRYADMPLVVLVNGYSASASEIMSGSLQDHRRATIVGERSFGKGSAQTLVPIRTDGGMALVGITSSKWFLPADRAIQGGIDPKTDLEIKGTGGVVPDVEVPVSEDDGKAVLKSVRDQLVGRPASGADAALDRAIALLSARP